MSYEKRDNSGTLGRNKNKQEENHPTHAGAATVDGVDYWVNAWVKENRESGEKFFSLSFKPKNPKPNAVNATPLPKAEEGFSDEIPFN